MTSLAVLTFLPLLGALCVALARKDQLALQRGIALVSTGIVAAMGIAVFVAFRMDSSQAQLVFDRPGSSCPEESRCASSYPSTGCRCSWSR